MFIIELEELLSMFTQSSEKGYFRKATSSYLKTTTPPQSHMGGEKMKSEVQKKNSLISSTAQPYHEWTITLEPPYK